MTMLAISKSSQILNSIFMKTVKILCIYKYPDFGCACEWERMQKCLGHDLKKEEKTNKYWISDYSLINVHL